MQTCCISIFAPPHINNCLRKLIPWGTRTVLRRILTIASANSSLGGLEQCSGNCAMLTKMTKCYLLFVIIYISLFFVFYFNPNCRSLVVSVQRCASVCALSTTEMHSLSPFFPTDTRHFPAAPVLPVFSPMQ